MSLAAAQANAWTTDWSAAPPTRPAWTGTQTVTPALSALRALIDWGPFFRTWELKGAYPALLSDPVVGEQARSLQADADAMLDRIEREGWLQARGVVGIFPANARGDDVVLWADDARASAREVLHTLRQQNAKSSGRPNLALADFVAPEGVEDWVGAFAVTAGLGIAPHVARFEADHDDYNAILLKALADRLAEAFAEHLHRMVRQELWAYAPDEALSGAELVAERYRGIRPAPGYPACPDHTEKRTLWRLLDVEANTGISLTESMAMMPAASVSGLYFAHPDAHTSGSARCRRTRWRTTRPGRGGRSPRVTGCRPTCSEGQASRDPPRTRPGPAARRATANRPRGLRGSSRRLHALVGPFVARPLGRARAAPGGLRLAPVARGAAESRAASRMAGPVRPTSSASWATACWSRASPCSTTAPLQPPHQPAVGTVVGGDLATFPFAPRGRTCLERKRTPASLQSFPTWASPWLFESDASGQGGLGCEYRPSRSMVRRAVHRGQRWPCLGATRRHPVGCGGHGRLRPRRRAHRDTEEQVASRDGFDNPDNLDPEVFDAVCGADVAAGSTVLDYTLLNAAVRGGWSGPSAGRGRPTRSWGSPP